MDERIQLGLTFLLGITLLLVSIPLNSVKNKKEGFSYEIINISKGCFSSKMKEGTTSSFENGEQKTQTIIKTPNPCYGLDEFQITKRNQTVDVGISLKSSQDLCVQCIGYFKIKYNLNTSKKLYINSSIDFKNLSEVKTPENNESSSNNKTEEIGEFCGKSTHGQCTRDNHCETGGTYNQICQSTYEPPILGSSGYKKCYDSSKYNLSCQCIRGSCQWN